jgi:glycosyltransferase involved in cell wall biosynthesis
VQSPSKTYVVVTAYNEARYLASFLKKLQATTTAFIVVDDGSSDRTAEIAKTYTKNVLIHPVNLGKGAAMKTGADYAFDSLGAHAVIFMDGDDQHDPADLAKFYALLTESNQSAKLIFGIRHFDQNMPIQRKFGNRFTSLLVSLLFGAYLSDIPSGFKAMNKAVYKQLRWQSSDYGVELEIACKVAKLEIPFSEVMIKTIYHDLDRGMNLLEAFKMIHKIVLWRINL